MSDITSREEEMAAEISRLQGERPYLDNLFRSFGPILLQRQRWLQKRLKPGKTFQVDPVKYTGGISLVQQCQGFFEDKRWHDAGLAAAGAIGRGLPDLAMDMDYLADRIRGGLDCQAMYLAAADPNQLELNQRAAEIGIKEVSFVVFLRSVERMILGLRAMEMAEELAKLNWQKGYCPVCGSFPHLAVIREKGQRWLQCPKCSHEWIFPRMTCPYCEHEDPENTGFLFVEGKKEEMAYTCDKCRKYLITIDQSGNLRHISADLLAISLAHLDIVVQEQGLQPMVQCEWNTYQNQQ